MHLIKLTGKELHLHFNDKIKFGGFSEIKAQYEKNLANWKSQLTYDSIRAKPYDIIYDTNRVDIFTGPLLYSETRALQDTMVQIKNTELFSKLSLKAFNSISLTVSVISSDGELLVGLRSNRVHTYKNYWAIGVAEGLEAKDFEAHNIEFAIKRGLIEEINIDLTEKALVSNLCVIEDEEKFSTSLYSVVDFRGLGEAYSSQEILKKALTAEDSWEHEKILFIKPTYEALLKEAQNQPLIAYTEEFISLVQDYLKKS